MSPICTVTGLLSGKNKGNQLNMPSVWLCGAIDSDSSANKVLSKKPATPCKVMLVLDSKLILPYLQYKVKREGKNHK